MFVYLLIGLLLLPCDAPRDDPETEAGWHNSRQQDVQSTPPPPIYTDMLGALPTFGRRLRVSVPCIGIHGCGHAFRQMAIPVDYVDVFDLEAEYKDYLEYFLRSIGQESITVHAGQDKLPTAYI